ncbi:MAG: methylaspartate ammonia-lyase [Steroidobacteraceae bacterium]
MRVQDVVFSVGESGYFHRDLMAMKAGARADGFIFHGEPVLPGYKSIVEPGTTISVMLVLEDGQVAFGDCADVILAGAAGRDRVFNADEHLELLNGEVRKGLTGLDVNMFRPNAEKFDRLQFGGKPMHMALRYGISQTLLHATALSGHETMAEVIAREYDATISETPIPILASGHRDDPLQLDRTILKRPELLPHASFTTVEHVGRSGEKLLAFADVVATRLRQIGGHDYRPRIHLDVYGTLGELFGNDIVKIAAYLATLVETVQPYGFLIESPIIAKTQREHIDLFRKLRETLRRNGTDIGVIADEWCNTLEDVKLFTDEQAADFLQIKTPDLGGINNSIEAVLYCKQHGMGAALGGTANESDQSARICTHVALACRPDFMLSKPGLGVDEALMIQRNEMGRTLALLGAKRERA